MVRTAYKMSRGLAFSEAKDMEHLREKALHGWHLKRFRLLGFEFEEGEPEDVTFNIDYRKLAADEEAEYFNMFEAGGWTHVCSEGTMHIFKAPTGTTPIYSDIHSAKDKLDRLRRSIQKAVAFTIGFSLLALLVRLFTTGMVQEIGRFVFSFSFVLTIPALMTFVAVLYHKWKLDRQV